MRKSLVVFLIFISLCAKGYAVSLQEEPQTVAKEVRYDQQSLPEIELDENQIKEYQADEDFNYKQTIEEDNWWTRFKKWLYDVYYSFMRWLIGDNAATGFWGGFVQALPYILLALFLGALVWLFLRIDSNRLVFESARAPQAFMGDDEDIIQNQDIQALIDSALASGNYRLAVRYYYLLALQKLSAKDYIDWQVQKTNHEYIFEIEDSYRRSYFRRVTDIYDYIWYGNFEVDESAFAKAQSAFNQLNSTL
ncbi:DUF4129 domain-containing protein [Dokdonia sinensis]|uniref:DUF4129 domain-containing protein n=1 Tax=Dokdonia sinensis TaxID=2479847 RepID=A0A3M0GGG9_9FLAO|nr:DUF4129 domain-containing protein [Dokdonia sinensis]RMB64025.1 DUF4129 domain-containing protein [Dokdonia sinensis]